MDKIKLSKTNAIWNELKLNSPWSVGFVSSLINKEKFNTEEEWVNYYYQSGEERKKIISTLPAEQQLLLYEPDISDKDLKSLSYDIKNLNFNYGRTREELIQKGFMLYGAIKLNSQYQGISAADCILMTNQRVLYDTFDGILKREVNTVNMLKRFFPKIEFRQLEGVDDTSFAVDYEAYLNNERIFGIQIKPDSYTGDSKHILKAKELNEVKNKKYSNKYNVPVVYVFSNMQGRIKNKEVIDDIREIISKI